MTRNKDYSPPPPSLQSLSQEQFEALFCRFYPQIVAYTTTLLSDQTAGEDIAQEVFVYVWEKRQQLYLAEGFHAYLFRSAYSRCIDYIQRNNRLKEYTKQSLIKSAEEYQPYLDNDCHPIKELFSRDFEEKLNTLLQKLPEARRQAFELVYRQGLKAKEVAAKMQLSQRTVESHIYLTLKYLRKYLSPADFLIVLLYCNF